MRRTSFYFFLFFLLLPIRLWAYPSITNPDTPRNIQRDLNDVSDDLNSRIKKSSNTLCMDNPTLCVNRFTHQILIGTGTAALPIIAWYKDPLTGIYFRQAGEMNISISGTGAYGFQSALFYPLVDNAVSLGQSVNRWSFINVGPGAASGPSVRIGEANSGWYLSGTHQVSLSLNGSPSILFDPTGINFYTSGGIALEMGSATFFPATDIAMSLGASGFRWTQGWFGSGSNSAPSLSIGQSNSGWYLFTGGEVDLTLVGTRSYQFASGVFAPTSDNTVALGGGGNRWANVSIGGPTGYKLDSNTILPVVQIVTASVATASSTTVGTFVNTNLAVTITPKYNTSKIFVQVAGTSTQAAGASGYLTIARGSTNLASSASGFHAQAANTTNSVNMIVYDSPATTSATTYTAQMKADSGVTIAFPTNAFATVPSCVITAIEYAQ